MAFPKKTFGISDFSRIWTFTVGIPSPQYPDFISAMADLMKRGYVAQDQTTLQFGLTLTGIGYCKENEANLERFNGQRFFPD
jgi:hypothetical protein